VNGFDLTTRLADYGIYFRAIADAQAASNPIGGLRSGTRSEQYLYGGVDVDLQKAIGWKGAKLHAHLLAETGHGLSAEAIGGGIDVQSSYSPFSLLRFLNLTLEQNLTLLRPDDLQLVAGRMGVTTYFARTEYSCEFMNKSFCNPAYGFSQNTGASTGVLATWAAKASLKTSDTTYSQIGVFAVDPATQLETTTLFDLSADMIRGATIVAESGYGTTFLNATFPSNFKLGAWYNTAPQNHALLNTAFESFVLKRGTRLTYTGGTGVYLVADQVLFRPDLSSKRNLALFATFHYAFHEGAPIRWLGKVGLVQTGTFGARDADTFGVAFSVTEFSAAEVAFFRDSRQRGGGTGVPYSNEFVLEANYGYRFVPGVTARPNIQYIVRPDPRYSSTTPSPIPNALVFGLELTVNFAEALGMPRIP
jgi:porin